MVGRYIVLGRLGAGAMGEVLAAYDPRLDRKVAVKRIHPGEGGLEAARLRLEREAQALAKLDHPNVVKVHDVIVQYESVFVAMEFVEGHTLADWLGEGTRRRGWRELLPIFEAFASGLAAVHAVGLVHRDVKPGNVMIGTDGRVRVMDFGLARSEGEPDEASESSAVHEIPEALAALRDSLASSQAQELTQAGAMLGTPAYMAPEQFSGLRATARSDQFAFCVTLHEALWGVRPFAGKTVIELCAAVLAGEREEPPRDVAVPGWLRAIVLRGLSQAPRDRFASMAELLVALRAGELRIRRRRYAALGLGVVAALLVGLGLQRWDLAQREQACVAEREQIEALWSSDAQASVEAGMLASELSYAATSVERVRPWLDAYVAALGQQSERACVAAEVERSWSDDTRERARWCLEQRRSALVSLLGRLGHAEVTDVHHAVASAAALESATQCTDLDVLDSLGPPPAVELRPQLLVLQDRLALVARIDSSEELGQGAAQLELVREIQREARALPWLPLANRAQQLEARLLRLLGKPNEAETLAAAAYREAARAGLWSEASRAAILVGSILATQPLRLAEARLWLDNAELARVHAGDPHGLVHAEIESARASVDLNSHAYAAALVHGEAARRGLEQVFGSEHPRLAEADSHQSEIFQAKGDYASALELDRAALDLRRRSFGANHPATARAMSSIAELHAARGERDEAVRLYQQVLAIFELDELSRPDLIRTLNLLGMTYFDQGMREQAREQLERAAALIDTTPNLSRRLQADTLNNLGLTYRGLRRNREARDFYERALAIFVEVVGTDSNEVAALHNNVAVVLYFEGDIEGCAKRLELAIEIEERLHGTQHPDLVTKLVNLARTRARLGEYEQALDDMRRAMAIHELAFGRGGGKHAVLYWRLGGIQELAGDLVAARANFELALEMLESEPQSWASELAQVRISLGQLRWKEAGANRREREQARALVERECASLSEQGTSEAKDCATWLDEHPT
jgi:tetratricopeptide (TPR) repeat protein/tRNA A-37 threonylcarbamoyl transferase component Bud32